MCVHSTKSRPDPLIFRGYPQTQGAHGVGGKGGLHHARMPPGFTARGCVGFETTQTHLRGLCTHVPKTAVLVVSGARARVGSAPELPVASLGQNLRALGFGRVRYHPHFFVSKLTQGPYSYEPCVSFETELIMRRAETKWYAAKPAFDTLACSDGYPGETHGLEDSSRHKA
jgi:hypothetical protein